MGRTFSSSGVPNASVMARLRKYVTEAGVAVEAASLNDLSRVLSRAPRSAPGPDGIAYEHRAQSGHFVMRTLREAYLAVLSDAPPPAGLNDGRTLVRHWRCRAIHRRWWRRPS